EIRREALALSLKLGRYSDAAAHAEYLLKVYPTDAGLWQELGAAQTGLNRLPEARKSYETAITLAPTDILAYQRLAQLLWRNIDDPAGAREVLDRMVAAVPQEPEAYLVRARFDKLCVDDDPSRGRGVGDINRAIADLNRVLELDPLNADAQLMLA